LNNRRQ